MTLRDSLTRAAALFRRGDTAAAIPAYEALLRHYPDLPDSWFNLGILYRRAGRFDDALAAYDRALAHRIGDGHEVLVQQAVILSEDLACPADARALLERAVAQAPTHVPAWLNLGNLAEEAGDFSTAEAAYRRSHAIDPADGLALARLLGVAGGAGEVDAARAFLARGGDPQALADVGYALGAALDQMGDYDAAFAAYVAANATARDMAARQGVRYDPLAIERFVDRSIAAFTLAAEPTGDDPAAPVFICGMFRSGSTLVEHLLARHPGVAPGGEIDALPRLSSTAFANDPARVAATTDEALAQVRGAYLALAAPWRRAGRRLTDKRPDNVLHLGLAQRLFPGATIVNTVRHPVDVCLSVFFLHAGIGMPYATDMADIAHYWRQQRRLMRHWRGIGVPVHTVDYDELVAAPEPVLAALCEACGLTPTDLAALPPSTHAVRTASVAQVRRPLYRGSSGRWRHYARHLTPVWEALIEEDRA